MTYQQIPTDIEGVDALVELALDLRSSWHHGADTLWQQLDPELWVATQNPWAILQAVSRNTLGRLLSDTAFRKNVDELVEARRDLIQKPAWFQQTYSNSPLNCIAYFSMEFMLSEALPIYSGGLGNVAGDQLKAAHDLGIPVIGVGLLYQQGYFRQMIDADGQQQAAFPYNDPGQLPITPLRQAKGDWLRIKLDLPGHTIWLRAWQAQVGRLKLYLLDSNDVANYPSYRAITSELYGGGPELRLMQEMVLGIGGWRLLAALGIEPEVCHLNEGHAAFAVLERAKDFMLKTRQNFDVALSVTRAGNLFTTHTAVPAGFDRFDASQIEHCLGAYAEEQLGISRAELLALGRKNPGDEAEQFNMAYLAIRGSGAINGVSRLHGEVSRRLFAPLFPHWPVREVPVGYITNGVHTPTWDSAAADELWTEACGQDRWLGTTDSLGGHIVCIEDAELWSFRSAARATLVEYVRERVADQRTVSNLATRTDENTKSVLDPEILTIGFARRFATYKRADLLLHDPARLLRLLNHRERPIQLVIAGKAHPADLAGQALIQKWIKFIQQSDVHHRVVFLSDYDMHLAEHLVQGVDVWLNTPRRPWEASGTSGMKVLVNGGINLSELDGWWAEAYTPEVGWALGDGAEHGDDPAWDAAEAEALYHLLENQVTDEFYGRDEHAIPHDWVKRMRNSMAQLTPQFSTNRTVREYTENYYLPAATEYQKRAAQQGKLGQQIVNWRQTLEKNWQTLRFGAIKVETAGEQHEFELEVYLGELTPKEVLVEIYAESGNGDDLLHQSVSHTRKSGDPEGIFVFKVSVPTSRPVDHYTARLRPSFTGVSTPLEAALILWQR
jgi:starch phosphorylase